MHPCRMQCPGENGVMQTEDLSGWAPGTRCAFRYRMAAMKVATLGVRADQSSVPWISEDRPNVPAVFETAAKQRAASSGAIETANRVT